MINMCKRKKPDRVRNWTVMYLQQKLQLIPWGALNVRWLLRFISSWGKLVGHLYPCFDQLLLDMSCHQREDINLCKTSSFNGRSSIANTFWHLREWIPQSWKGLMELTAAPIIVTLAIIVFHFYILYWIDQLPLFYFISHYWLESYAFNILSGYS